MRHGQFDLIKLLAGNDVDFVLVGGLAFDLQSYQRVTSCRGVDIHLIAMKTGTGRGKDTIRIDALQKLLPGNAA